MAYFVRQNVHGRETRRGVRLSECVCGTEFGYDARIFFGTHAADSRETCMTFPSQTYNIIMYYDIVIAVNYIIWIVGGVVAAVV